MNYSLCLQATHKQVDIALCQDGHIVSSAIIPNHTSSSSLIPLLDQLLKDNNLSIKDCIYIAANQGPAPFTTLRTILATINGIHAAIGTPLVGVDGLRGLMSLYASNKYPCTVVLLNAFNNELYYAINVQNGCIIGYAPVQQIEPLIQKTVNGHSALLIGNGLELVENYFPSFFANENITADLSIKHCTIVDIAQLAWAQWNSNSLFNTPLMPLYLKKHAAERAQHNIQGYEIY